MRTFKRLWPSLLLLGASSVALAQDETPAAAPEPDAAAVEAGDPSSETPAPAAASEAESSSTPSEIHAASDTPLAATAGTETTQTTDTTPASIEVQPLRAPDSATAEVEPADSARLDSVEVTASYRKENIQDVTGSAQAFSGHALDKAGVVGMEDYLRQVPSVSLQKSGNGKTNIAMRGISNINANDTGYGAGSPTVGVYLNDVGIQGSGVFPDLNIYDLQRIEVLKGPQGTLYGEGSMGGAIKMVANAPDSTRWEARSDFSVGKTDNGSLSHDLRAALNIPLIDEKLGARVVGNVRHTGGFVDYTSLGRADANSIDAESLRAIASWRPTGTLELEYLYLVDDELRNQFPVTDEGKEEELVNSGEENQYASTRFSIHALTARWALPFANLTAVSALYNTERDSVRRTPVLQNLLQTQVRQTGATAPNVFSNAPMHVNTELDSFSQELRLVSFGGDTFDWIAGAFYRDRTQHYDQQKYENSVPNDPTGLFTGVLGSFNPVQGLQENGFGDEGFQQAALYGELTWNVIPTQFEITGGLRVFQEDVSFSIDTRFYGVEAYLLATDPNNIDLASRSTRIYFAQSITTRGLLPKLSAAWHFNEDHMIYASLARGFRSGTANVYSALKSGPPLIQPDYVWNQEIGTKSTWLDGNLVTNLAAYRIDWQDLQGTVLGTAQLGAVPVDFAHLDNAGDAVVMGAEAAVMWSPLTGLTLLGNVGYNEGHITKPSPSSGIPEGARLPNTPRLTWSSTATYSWPMFWGVTDVSATYTFVGDQIAIYEVQDGKQVAGTDVPGTQQTAGGNPLPSFALLKANAGVRQGAFRFQVYGDNLTNEHAVIAISAPIAQSTVITPRTVGVRIGYEF